MKKYFSYVKKHPSCFILGPLFMVLEACGEFILPYINANIINIGAANRDIPYIIRSGIFMLVIAASMLLFGVLGANFAIRGSARLAAHLRLLTFSKIENMSFSQLDRFRTGPLITRITNDVTQVQNFTQTLLRGMFRSPVMIIGAVIMSFALNRSLAVVILIVVPLLAAVIALIIKTASPRYSVMQQKLDSVNSGIGETVQNERLIKSFVREEHEKAKFASANDELAKKSSSALKMMLLLQPVSTLAINATTLIVVWIAGNQIVVGDMPIGTLTAFITYLSQVLTALSFIANIVLQGTRAAASDRRISEVLDSPAEPCGKDNAPILHGSVEFRNVSFSYYKDNPEMTLADISLKIEPGEFVGIIGSTGSGKSTLVSLISRLYDADNGEVIVDGRNVRDISNKALRESAAVVLQKNTLFSGTISENLRWGNENASYDEQRAAAKTAAADRFISELPQGYETELGQGGVNLSGGQKQRLCIARAILRKPKILILDDSTSAVDTATDAAIRHALRRDLPETTKIVIAQRTLSVSDADKIVVMESGRIIACDKHEKLLECCSPYREIYYSQNERREVREDV